METGSYLDKIVTPRFRTALERPVIDETTSDGRARLIIGAPIKAYHEKGGERTQIPGDRDAKLSRDYFEVPTILIVDGQVWHFAGQPDALGAYKYEDGVVQIPLDDVGGMNYVFPEGEPTYLDPTAKRTLAVVPYELRGTLSRLKDVIKGL